MTWLRPGDARGGRRSTGVSGRRCGAELRTAAVGAQLLLLRSSAVWCAQLHRLRSSGAVVDGAAHEDGSEGESVVDGAAHADGSKSESVVHAVTSASRAALVARAAGWAEGSAVSTIHNALPRGWQAQRRQADKATAAACGRV